MSKSQLNQNLWHKLQMLLTSLFFNFGRKKIKNLFFKSDHFLTICGHLCGNYIDIFHKTEIQKVILRCLVCLNLNWIKSYDIIIGWNIFFSCLKMHHFSNKILKYTEFMFGICTSILNKLISGLPNLDETHNPCTTIPQLWQSVM